MISSRLLTVGRILGSRLAQGTGASKQLVRHSHGTWTYRTVDPAPRKTVFIAECIGGLMWWWILWHLYHEPEAIYGHFPYPDPAAWTNEELGIPPDDFEE